MQPPPATPSRPQSVPSPRVVQWATPGSDPYEACFAVVRQAFLRDHGCAPERRAPRYLYLEDPAGGVVAALGVWRSEEGLFSEQYLDAPAEDVVTAAVGRTVSRDQVWEVGSLAAVQPAAALAIVRACPVPLWWFGVRWVLVTVTPAAAAVIRRAGIELAPLARALPGRVQDPAAWGRYYESQPELMLLDGWQAYVAVSDARRSPSAPVRLSMAL